MDRRWSLCALLTLMPACVNELDPEGRWQTTETIRAGDCGSTMTMTSVRNWNVTNNGDKVIDADDPNAVYTGDFQCTVTDCTAAITGAVMIGTDRIEIRNFLTLAGETNEITGNRTVEFKGSMPCSFTNPVTGKRFALP